MNRNLLSNPQIDPIEGPVIVNWTGFIDISLILNSSRDYLKLINLAN